MSDPLPELTVQDAAGEDVPLHWGPRYCRGRTGTSERLVFTVGDGACEVLLARWEWTRSELRPEDG